MTKADGGKFGKTEKGNIWLDPGKTSPFEFYQFWLNASDMDAEKWIRIFTFLTKDALDDLINQHHQKPEARMLQKALAREVTVFVHGQEEYDKAVETTEKLFSNQSAPISSLSINDLQMLEGIVNLEYSMEEIKSGKDIVSFLSETGIFTSKGEARKMVQNGGISINRNKVSDVTEKLQAEQLLYDQYLLVQKGRKNYFLVKVS
jgi:tyrosyl-tRNA synthetase